MRARALLLLFGILMTPILACGGSGHEGGEPHQEPGPPPIRARASTALLEELPALVALQGTVEAERTAAVSARVMATVSAVHVRAGDRVRAGQLLLTIDPETADGQAAQARGALAQVRAALTLAERNHQRFQALAERQAASELEVDMARMQYEQALGAVEQAEGALAAASSVAADSRVSAPFAGRVLRRLVEVGDLATPGRPLVQLESEGGRRLVLAVPESVVAASGLEVGSQLRVSLDAHSDLGELVATVVEMAPGADPLSRSFAVEASLPVEGVASGAAGRAVIETGRRQAVTVPTGAVLRHGGLELVVLVEEGRASSRAVTTGGATAEGRVEVLSGLAGGERVLLDLGLLPPAGSPVEEEG